MAAFFWIHAGGDTNVGTVNNWSATSGGGTNGATPSVTSDVTYDGAGANGNDASTVAASVSFLSLTFTSGYTNTITINTTRVLTIAGNFTDNTAHSWTVSGTGAMTISAASTITSGGKTFPGPVTFSGANTKALSGDWTISGKLTITGSTVLNKTSSETLILNGGTTLNAGCIGTAAISLTGGTWSGGNAIQNNLTLAGNITISGGVAYQAGTITYSSGTITVTGSILNVGASTTFNTAGMSWASITIIAASTITLNSLLTLTGTLLINDGFSTTFAGTAGFTVATLTISSTATSRTLTLVNSVTYTITTGLNAFRTAFPGSTITSNDGTLKANLTLNNGATCNVLANFTRIDASAGRTIFTFNGTITDCINITAITDLTFAVGRAVVIQGNSNF